MRFISLFASFGHNFKYSSSSHIFLSCPIPYLRLPQIPSLIPCIFHLLAFVTCRDTHDTRWHTNPRPTRRDISVTDDRSPVVDFHGELILFLHVDFSLPLLFPTTFAAPLTNDYCLSEIRTATISTPGVYYFRRRCRERRDPSIRLHSFLLFRQHHRRLRAGFRFFP